MRTSSLLSLLLASAAVPVWAQDSAPGEPNAVDDKALPTDIVVTAERIKGAVDTDVPPVEELGEADIAAVGASSLTDLVAAVSPQTGSGRGRGGGQPVILLNGQRISGFRELRDLPPEAVKQVQIFPEEVALKYGFRPDQRVINFILKDNFASFSGEVEHAQPEDGGFGTNQVETTLTRIGASTRLNIDIEHETSSRLTENERGIIPANAGTFDNSDIGQFRSLLPKTERFEVNSTWSKALAPQTTMSLNANYALNGSSALLGLPGASFVLPGSSPFSPSGTDITINRYFDSPRALERESESHTFQSGGTFNALIGGWRWTVTGNYARIDSDTRTTRNVDFALLRTAVLAGTANPFAADFGENLLFLAPDLNNSLSQNIETRSTLAGSPVRLPSGEAQITFSSGFTRQLLDSDTWRSGVTTDIKLRRNIFNHAVNAEVPLTGRDFGIGKLIGELAINGNIGFSDLSDFGTLIEYGAGLRWSPVKDLTFQASIIGDENAPEIGQLGNPLLVTPNVTTYDFTRGESLFINVTTGGNPLLVGEKRRDLKLSLNWSPSKIEGLGLQLEYFKNNSSNTTAFFPLLTPEIEAAFPGRVIRDASGRLVSIDQRPVNFDREKSQRIRWGFNMSGGIGPKPQERGQMGGLPGGRPAGGPPPGAGGGFRGGGPRMGGGGGGLMPVGGMPSRWSIALYHIYRIQEEILISPGVPVLNLLNGSATSSSGGVSRHEVELSGGVFHKGMGFRLQGTYKSGSTVDGTGLPGSSDLRFSGLTSLDASVWVNLDGRGKLTEKLPFLKGSRIRLRVNNVLNDVIDVRDENGIVPLSYQPGYIDPRGRVLELSFRKRF